MSEDRREKSKAPLGLILLAVMLFVCALLLISPLLLSKLLTGSAPAQLRTVLYCIGGAMFATASIGVVARSYYLGLVLANITVGGWLASVLVDAATGEQFNPKRLAMVAGICLYLLGLLNFYYRDLFPRRG